MRFFRFPTAMVRPLSSLATFSFVISNMLSRRTSYIIFLRDRAPASPPEPSTRGAGEGTNPRHQRDPPFDRDQCAHGWASGSCAPQGRQPIELPWDRGAWVADAATAFEA